MDLAEQIQKDMVQAMKAKERARVSVLRMMRAALKNKEIEKKAALSEEDAIQVLKTQLKQCTEAIEQFEKGGRADLAEKERQEKVWTKSYLPEPVSAGEIDTAVAAAIEELGAQGPKDMGGGHERNDGPPPGHGKDRGRQSGERPRSPKAASPYPSPCSRWIRGDKIGSADFHHLKSAPRFYKTVRRIHA